MKLHGMHHLCFCRTEGAAHASSVWDNTKGGAAYGLEIIFIINTKNFIYNFKYEF